MDRQEARRRLDEFLHLQFGEDLCHAALGPIGVQEDSSDEYDNAEVFLVNTIKAMESGNVVDGLMSGGVVVPKDGSPVHWAPTAIPVPDYLRQVADGERWWSAPSTEVSYYGLLSAGRTRSNPSGVLRRRSAEGRSVDEVFTRNLRWEPTDYFEKYRLGHDEDDHVEITAAEAADFVRRIRAKLSR